MTAETSAPRARTIPMQRMANRIVRGLLRTPLLCRVAGRRLVTLQLTGRTTGRRYTIPVAYVRSRDDLLVGTPFGWGRNLRTGQTVTVRLKGALRTARVRVITDEAGVVARYAEMARSNRQFAGLNSIRIDRAGEPNAEDLHLAWAAGARAFLLTLQPRG